MRNRTRERECACERESAHARERVTEKGREGGGEGGREERMEDERKGERKKENTHAAWMRGRCLVRGEVRGGGHLRVE